MTLPTPSDCCEVCPTPLVVNIPGPQGPPCEPCADGGDGLNAYSQLVDGFTMPAYGANTPSLAAASSVWMALGQIVFVQVAGYMRVAAKVDSTHVTLTNIATAVEYPGNANPTDAIAPAMFISPGGLQGAAGAAGSTVVFPTNTKGDLIADDGANNPAPSVGRVAAGTDGQVVAYDAAAARGIVPTTVAPNSATDNAIARFNGASGKPVPTQNSAMLITDDGDLQIGSGDAKGANATDLQTQRTSASNVASGARAGVLSGKNNRASGQESVVAGGLGNFATALNSAIGGGSTNLASNQGAMVPGGENNIASGQDSFAAGKECVAAGPYCVATGLQGIANVHAMKSHSAGFFAKLADANTVDVVLRNLTTDATPTALFLDGSAVKITPSGGQTIYFRGSVVGVRGDVGGLGDSAAWTFEGLLACFFAPVLVAAVTPALVAASPGAATWALTVTIVGADLVLTVTGQVGANIRWHSDLRFNVAGWLP